MDELLKTYWQQISMIVAAVVYALRVEGRLNHVEKVQETDGARMLGAMDKMSQTQEKMSEAINEMRTTLAGVVGYEKGAQEARTKRGQR